MTGVQTCALPIYTAAYKTVIVGNLGDASLSISSITQTNEPFSISDDNCSGEDIAPGEDCTLTIRFSPDSEGTFDDSFDILSSDPYENVVTVDLSGIGIISTVPPGVNNAPSDFELIYPEHEQTGLPTTVTFEWTQSSDPDGDTVVYDLYYCEKSDFEGCTPILIEPIIEGSNAYYAGIGIGYGAWMILFGIAFAGGLRDKRRIGLLIAALVVTGMFVVSCGGSGSSGSSATVPDIKIQPTIGPNDNVTYTVDELNSNTTYHWKVVAKDGKGGATHSEVRSFTTT